MISVSLYLTLHNDLDLTLHIGGVGNVFLSAIVVIHDADGMYFARHNARSAYHGRTYCILCLGFPNSASRKHPIESVRGMSH